MRSKSHAGWKRRDRWDDQREREREVNGKTGTDTGRRDVGEQERTLHMMDRSWREDSLVQYC